MLQRLTVILMNQCLYMVQIILNFKTGLTLMTHPTMMKICSWLNVLLLLLTCGTNFRKNKNRTR